MECTQRACLHCGVDEIKFLPEETSDEGEVVWKRYQYVETVKTGPDGKEQKKIALVQKKTPPKEFFDYLIQLLKPHPYHSFLPSSKRNSLTI